MSGTNDMLDEGMMTDVEVAEFLSISRRTVHKLLKSGQLPSSKIGYSRRIPKVAVKRLIARGLTL